MCMKRKIVDGRAFKVTLLLSRPLYPSEFSSPRPYKRDSFALMLLPSGSDMFL